jgi:hypothetical protein
LRGDDALARLMRVVERRDADVVTAQVRSSFYCHHTILTTMIAQVFDGSPSGLPADTDTSHWDAARFARHTSLYLGCADDAALVRLVCYTTTHTIAC